MDDQRTDREGGRVRFVQLTIKVPVPVLREFRYGIKSLLILTLFVAVACSAWKVYRGGEHARLQQQLREAKIARDATLQKWKVAASNQRKGGIAATKNEPALRVQYFKDRDAVEGALQRLARYEGHTER